MMFGNCKKNAGLKSKVRLSSSSSPSTTTSQDEASPRAIIRILATIWGAFALFACAMPLKVPVAARLIAAAGSTDASVVISAVVQLFLGVFSLVGASIMYGFQPSEEQSTEVSSAFMAMSLTQIYVFKSLSRFGIALAACQLIVGIYFQNLTSKLAKESGKPPKTDFFTELRAKLEAQTSGTSLATPTPENGEPAAIIPEVSEPETAAKPTPKTPAQSAAGLVSFMMVLLSLAMLVAPLKFVGWAFTANVQSLLLQNEALKERFLESIRNVFSVVVIACGRVFAGVDDKPEVTAGTARALYFLGGALLVFSRGLFGAPVILARTPCSILGFFCVWNGLNFSAFTAKAKIEQEAAKKREIQNESRGVVIDVQTHENK
eukprot:CAMPEP_0182447548 /NCGR_PEP_ID=MMETSP1172-20130603/17338_1 /TAXON_ID=708627 /ORGANISM="Timspurckia oligopyrenoides, Strain CCMP3278" /LENGTH=375 /DNA_ID=CAMNT_0024644031 /DNA_START=105 /DNA_END=1232 /DNA_ORIENTATION=+